MHFTINGGGKTKMKCVICKVNKANNDYTRKLKLHKPITCGYCRRDYFPKFMKDAQFCRYWDAHNIKWLKENK